MGCNCKTKKDADKLIRKVEELDNSKSKDYVRMNKPTMKVLFSTISLGVYLFFIIMSIILVVPILLYMIITGKSIIIKPIELIKNGQQQIV